VVKTGARVAAVKARLLELLSDRGESLTGEANLRLLADGAPVAPVSLPGGLLAFVAPEGCAHLRLCSRSFVPAHTMPESDDDRRLGVCVTRLQIDGDDLALDDPRLSDGWNQAESDRDRIARRWTTGDAALPAGARLIVIALGGHGRYWRQRAARALARAV
jgi:hypothetical protein